MNLWKFRYLEQTFINFMFSVSLLRSRSIVSRADYSFDQKIFRVRSLKDIIVLSSVRVCNTSRNLTELLDSALHFQIRDDSEVSFLNFSSSFDFKMICINSLYHFSETSLKKIWLRDSNKSKFLRSSFIFTDIKNDLIQSSLIYLQS
jgi:hypothetical protein